MSWQERPWSQESEREALETIGSLLDDLEGVINWLSPGADLGYGYVIKELEVRQERWRFAHRMPQPEPQPKPYKKVKIPRDLARRVMERDAYRCKHCGTWLNLTVDHVVPERHGGTLDLDNLQTLCQSCNSRKGART